MTITEDQLWQHISEDSAILELTDVQLQSRYNAAPLEEQENTYKGEGDAKRKLPYWHFWGKQRVWVQNSCATEIKVSVVPFGNMYFKDIEVGGGAGATSANVTLKLSKAIADKLEAQIQDLKKDKEGKFFLGPYSEYAQVTIMGSDDHVLMVKLVPSKFRLIYNG